MHYIRHLNLIIAYTIFCHFRTDKLPCPRADWKSCRLQWSHGCVVPGLCSLWPDHCLLPDGGRGHRQTGGSPRGPLQTGGSVWRCCQGMTCYLSLKKAIYLYNDLALHFLILVKHFLWGEAQNELFCWVIHVNVIHYIWHIIKAFCYKTGKWNWLCCKCEFVISMFVVTMCFTVSYVFI